MHLCSIYVLADPCLSEIVAIVSEVDDYIISYAYVACLEWYMNSVDAELDDVS